MDKDPATTGPPHAHIAPDGAAIDFSATERGEAVGADRSPNARICPFLREGRALDVLGPPIESPDPANRCVAIHDPVPQSLRQQELVCLASGHVNCPRYLRGSMGGHETLERMTARRTITPATAGALAVFLVASILSVGFVVGNGGLVLTAAPPVGPSGAVLGEVKTAAPTALSTPNPTPSPTVAPTPSPSPSPSSTPSPSPTPGPSLRPSPTPTPTPSAKPTSGRFALVKPCSGTSDCYVYFIRSGDNLFSIAKYFGVSLQRIQSMNPWVKGGLTVGRGLRIPTPTR